MWLYEQVTGYLISPQGVRLEPPGYSGFGDGVNSPALEKERDEGPIPEGLYIMQPPVDTLTHGPYVIWLIPDVDNNMFGRANFGIHGDRKDWVTHPHLASLGCIVQTRANREAVWNSGDRLLKVIQQRS